MERKLKIIKGPEEILIIENILPQQLEDDIVERVCNNSSFPWFMIPKISHNYFYEDHSTPQYIDQNITDEVGFYHSASEFGKINSTHYDFFKTVLYFLTDAIDIKIKDIIRIRLRYTHQTKNHTLSKYAAPHVDFEEITENYKTLIYYINDSDGDTFLFDKLFDRNKETYNPVVKEPLKTIFQYTPTKGNAIYFNGHRYHSGNYPVNASSRIMINFDFMEKN